MEDEQNKVAKTTKLLHQAQKEEAEKNGLNFSDPQHLIIRIPNNGFTLKKTNKPLSSYNNGLLKMMIDNVLKKYPVGSMIFNDNISEAIKSGKTVVKRVRKAQNSIEA